ncbi:hypothetical protein WG66_008796 [Moniliophthora roreri]|nr:hypothetical protein WG66_008796 [Moniliophthora roreri]
MVGRQELSNRSALVTSLAASTAASTTALIVRNGLVVAEVAVVIWSGRNIFITLILLLGETIPQSKFTAYHPNITSVTADLPILLGAYELHVTVYSQAQMRTFADFAGWMMKACAVGWSKRSARDMM